jgi:DNA modification methylase
MTGEPPRRDSRRRRDGPDRRRGRAARPPLRIFTTTLWEYPSRHYEQWMEGGEVKRSGRLKTGPTGQPGPARELGDKAYAGATPAWVVWQLLMRYTRPGDVVVDPMAGSGTTLDVATDLGREALGYDLTPARPDIHRADARSLPLPDAAADFVFIDPPYSTHIAYSDDPADIGRLDAAGDDGGRAYYEAMQAVIAEIDRVLKDRRYMGLFVSDSFRKRRGGGLFMPIGFELFSILRERFRPIDIVCVVRQNAKLRRGNWHKAAEEQNFFLRGFNYLFIMKKERGGR